MWPPLTLSLLLTDGGRCRFRTPPVLGYPNNLREMAINILSYLDFLIVSLAREIEALSNNLKHQHRTYNEPLSMHGIEHLEIDIKPRLANHGFLPRNGSNITIPVVLQAINGESLFPLVLRVLLMTRGFNFEPIGITVATSKVALLTTDAEDSFSLSDLALHGTLEHDVSVSRNDFALGDNLHFNATVFATLNDSNPGFDFYNATSAARVLEQRLEEDKIVNPNLINTAKEFSIREIEAAFYLSTMGNVTSGVAPKKFVQVLFTEERLPLEEGWTPSEILIGEENFGNLLALIDNQTTWAASGEVICPWIRLQPEGGVTIVEG
ncbi:hypothetical protein D9757_003190 [Collybiopsis confluens]|uniref:Heme haloperoxidase family profile domain-containing protein n=1 Tax=Collybiopsis confluens TaxID=2823264 RepID=A0A8H5HYW3_9AGAR|nr:hypothetical protein D9757_003190 [Collybiopsis confluens]